MFTLDYRSRKPLYDQLCQSIERMAACGVLEPGSRLPSVRMLAEELAINPNTVQKAYRMLEHSGVIETVPGKGSFAAAEGGEQQRRIRELKTQAAPLLEELKTLGCTEEDLLQLWRGGETHA